MASTEVLRTYQDIITHPNPTILTIPILDFNQLLPDKGVRPNSFCIEDAFFGDSGKGSVVAKLNYLLFQKFGIVYSLRYNGGGNAGHETYYHGKKVVTNQLPMGVIQEGATAIISRCMVIHPEELLSEMVRLRNNLGEMPGKLLIDERTPLALDTHRAWEATCRTCIPGSKASTGRGISPAYASVIEKNQVTVKDLLSEDWKGTLTNHYHQYEKRTQGFGMKLEEIQVSTPRLLKDETRPVGTIAEFLDRLDGCRETLRKHTLPERGVRALLEEVWRNPNIPFTLEGAQGIGLDPYHGVYPDVTASRPGSRFIGDATYTIIEPGEIQHRVAVMKTNYVSSVGKRHLPAPRDEQQENWIRDTFDETGRTTGRPRGISLVSVPIGKYLRRAAGYHGLVATHLDASAGQPREFITHYTDLETGEEQDYSPYQDSLDKLQAHTVTFPGYDGKAIKGVTRPEDLPIEARRILAFLSRTIAPITFATYGPDLKEWLAFTQEGRRAPSKTLSLVG